MIDVKELRVGNWYQDGKYQEQIRHFDLSDWMLLQSAEPILLKPEILEKCGFENITEGVFPTYEYKGWFVLMSITDGEWFVTTEPNLRSQKYLHQLQNAIYALTGTELNYQP